jgi:hypothetical protein
VYGSIGSGKKKRPLLLAWGGPGIAHSGFERAESPHWHEGNLKEAMRVLQLNVPLAFRYSVVYQKVQSSTGSMAMLL